MATLAQPLQGSITCSTSAGVAADTEGELFDTFTEDGQPLGLQLRSVCHAQGIWHRAVYCFVFDPNGRVLLQRRSLKKKIGPGQWDLSCAEHLSPGETFRQGVLRGLQEELGLNDASEGALVGPLLSEHKRRLNIPAEGVKDYEFVESYRLDSYSGAIDYNSEEVMEVRWADVAEMRQDMQTNPEAYTIWFREELAMLGYFDVSSES